MKVHCLSAEVTDLAPRQREILTLAAAGLTDKEISAQIGLAEATIKTYWKRLRDKAKAKSRSELIARILTKSLERSRVEAQSYLRLLSHIREFAWLADTQGNVFWYNDYFSLFSGLSHGSLAGQGCKVLMPECELSESGTRWRRAQDTRCGYEAIVHFRSASGAYVQHGIRLEPFQPDEDKPWLWLGSASAVNPAATFGAD